MARPDGRTALAIFSIVLVSGCASGAMPVPTTVDVPGMPNPEAALRLGIDRVDAQMAGLGRIASAPTARPPLVPEELARPVTFQWNGPLDAGVRKLAGSIGYATVIEPPDAPSIPVTVAGQILPVVEILRALGEQVGGRATIELDPQRHQIRVIHHV